MAALSRLWEFRIRNPIRKVTIVGPLSGANGYPENEILDHASAVDSIKHKILAVPSSTASFIRN